MKNSIKLIGTIVLVLVTLFACEKKENEIKKEDQFSVAMKVTTQRGSTENGIMIGTKTELKTALTKKEGPIYLKKVATKNNVFVPVVGPTPADPSTLCWDEINAYYAANISQWQQAANETCTNVMICLTCPNAGGGLYVMYIIRPNSFKCNLAEAFEAQFTLAAFDFGDNDFESEAVAAHIKSK